MGKNLRGKDLGSGAGKSGGVVIIIVIGIFTNFTDKTGINY